MKLSNMQKFNILFILLLVRFLTGAGIDLYVPSLPFISKYFGVTAHSVKLTIVLYMLGYAVGQLSLGVLSDSIGRKKIILVSGLIFTLSSVLSIFAPNIYIDNL